MVQKRQPRRVPRGIGVERFEQIRRSRPPKKLEEKDTLLYEHALRCFCKLCGGLLNWECPADISYTETECCGLKYRLRPWTVIVEIEDVSSRAVLPKMEGSDYSDPNTDLSDQLTGELPLVETRVMVGLTKAQKSLGKPPEPKAPTTIISPRKLPQLRPKKKPSPPESPTPKRKTRKCGHCRLEGHDRRTCPNLKTDVA